MLKTHPKSCLIAASVVYLRGLISLINVCFAKVDSFRMLREFGLKIIGVIPRKEH